MRFTKGMEPFGGYAFLSYLKEISNYQNNLKTWDNRYIHVSHVRDQANVSAPCPFAFPLVAHNVRSKIQLPFPSSCSLGSQSIYIYICFELFSISFCERYVKHHGKSIHLVSLYKYIYI